MKYKLYEELDIPKGVSVNLMNGIFTVKGAAGEVSRQLYNPRIASRLDEEKIVFESKSATKREKNLTNTFIAHLKVMFKGASKGHNYKLKVCASHFPMTVSVKGSQLEIKNFFGEQVSRFVNIPQGASVKVQGQVISVESTSKELAGQTAARIEHATKRPGFDKRIFQDGIFIIDKDGEDLVPN
jgi:large subunit ribosomal protein L6